MSEVQIDVDHCSANYSEQGPHSGTHCFGKTPMHTFREARYLAEEKTMPAQKATDSMSDQTDAE